MAYHAQIYPAGQDGPFPEQKKCKSKSTAENGSKSWGPSFLFSFMTVSAVSGCG